LQASTGHMIKVNFSMEKIYLKFVYITEKSEIKENIESTPFLIFFGTNSAYRVVARNLVIFLLNIKS
jgi:hypothetical protein